MKQFILFVLIFANAFWAWLVYDLLNLRFNLPPIQYMEFVSMVACLFLFMAGLKYAVGFLAGEYEKK